MSVSTFKFAAWATRLITKFTKRSDLNNRADLLKEVRTVSGKKVVPNGVYYSPMPIIGIQPLSIEDILEPHKDVIAEIVKRSGLSRDKTKFSAKKLIEQVIWNTAEYIHLLPASEDYHHTDAGGLLSHSLEVAKMALGEAYNIDLPSTTYSDLEILRRTRYFYAVFVAALLHDIGKVFSDVRVFCVDSHIQWQPRLEPLTAWAVKNNVSSYRVEYRPGRGRSHERAANYVLSSVLTDEAKEYILGCKTDDIFSEIDEAITHYAERDGYIPQSLRRADSASTLKDIQGRHLKETGRREYSLSTHFIRATQQLTPKWKCNQKGSALWVVGGDIYIAFPQTIIEIMSAIKAAGVNCPHDVNVVYNQMVEQHIIENSDKETRSSFWMPGDFTEEEARQIQKDMVVNKKNGAWIAIARLKSVHYAYGSLAIPESKAGILCLNKLGDMNLYRKGELYVPIVMTAEDMHKRIKLEEEAAKAEAERKKKEHEEQKERMVAELVEEAKAAALIKLTGQPVSGSDQSSAVGTTNAAEPQAVSGQDTGAPSSTGKQAGAGTKANTAAPWRPKKVANKPKPETETPESTSKPESQQDITEPQNAAPGAAPVAQELAQGEAQVSVAGNDVDASGGVLGGDDVMPVIGGMEEQLDQMRQNMQSDERDGSIDEYEEWLASGAGAAPLQVAEVKSEQDNAGLQPPAPLDEKTVAHEQDPAAEQAPVAVASGQGKGPAQTGAGQGERAAVATKSKRDEMVKAGVVAPSGDAHQPTPSPSVKPVAKAGGPEVTATPAEMAAKAVEWLRWSSEQREHGIMMYRVVDGGVYLRVNQLSSRLMLPQKRIVQWLSAAGMIQSLPDPTGKAEQTYLAKLDVGGKEEMHCLLAQKGCDIMLKSNDRERDRREFAEVFKKGSQLPEEVAAPEPEPQGATLSAPDNAGHAEQLGQPVAQDEKVAPHQQEAMPKSEPTNIAPVQPAPAKPDVAEQKSMARDGDVVVARQAEASEVEQSFTGQAEVAVVPPAQPATLEEMNPVHQQDAAPKSEQDNIEPVQQAQPVPLEEMNPVHPQDAEPMSEQDSAGIDEGAPTAKPKRKRSKPKSKIARALAPVEGEEEMAPRMMPVREPEVSTPDPDATPNNVTLTESGADREPSDHHLHDDDPGTEVINSAALGDAFGNKQYRLPELQGMVDMMEKHWGRRGAYIEAKRVMEDGSIAIEADYFTRSTSAALEFPLSEAAEFRQKIEDKWYYVIPMGDN